MLSDTLPDLLDIASFVVRNPETYVQAGFDNTSMGSLIADSIVSILVSNETIDRSIDSDPLTDPEITKISNQSYYGDSISFYFSVQTCSHIFDGVMVVDLENQDIDWSILDVEDLPLEEREKLQLQRGDDTHTAQLLVTDGLCSDAMIHVALSIRVWILTTMIHASNSME